MTEPDKKSCWTVSVFFAALIVQVSYLLGSAFYLGYMEGFGVGADAFPISTQEVYVWAYQAVGFWLFSLEQFATGALRKLIHSPVVYWVAAILCLVIGGIYWLLKVFNREAHPTPEKAAR